MIKAQNSGLIAFYPLKNNEGQMAFDILRGEPMTGVNNPYYKSGSLYLNNTAQTTSSNQNAFKNLGNQFTISMWGKRELSNSGVLVTCVDTINSKTVWNIQHTTGGNFQMVVIASPNTTTGLIATVTSTATNIWKHYLAVYDGTQSTASNRIRLYINGIDVSGSMTDTIPSSLQNPQNTVLKFGGGLTGTYVANSYMKFVKLYNRPLTATEIRKLYIDEYNLINQS